MPSAQLGVEERPAEETVLQHVMRSDKQRETLLHEAKVLSEAVENTSDPTAVIRVYRELMHDRLERTLVDARRTAARRSGARGSKARQVLIKLEEDLVLSTASLNEIRLGSGGSHDVPDTAAGESQKAFEMLENTRSALEAMGASSVEAKARAVLLGLGFSAARLDLPVSQLSGGWKTRCSLACALCQSTDLLLLDEPTNYLDLPSIIWFENYIQNLEADTTVIVVTHDRAFADSVGEELLIVRNQAIEVYRGSLSGFEVTRLKKFKYLSRMQDAQDKQKKHIQGSIDQNVKAAKRAGDDKKLKQAASRKKKLEERMGMEVSAKGGRFKLNRDLAGYHTTLRGAIELPTFDPPAVMAFPMVPSDLRFPGALLSFEDISFSWKNGKLSTPVLNGVSVTIHAGDRVGLVGLNGSGKSTLVSLAMGSGGGATRTPTKGVITRHTRASFGLYSQQAVEELNEIAIESPTLTALTHLMYVAGPEMLEKDARGLLSSVGLSGRVTSDVPIQLLSGGQKVRLALAKLFWKPPHLLILDEVTTHLDSDTIQALALALRKYEGAILVVTHDRFFMRCVVEGESLRSMARQLASEQGSDDEESGDNESDDETGAVRRGVVYRLAKGKLVQMQGGMQEYEDRAAKTSAKLVAA